MQVLATVVKKLAADFGTWSIPWGEVNRFQRLTGGIQPIFDDAQPSLAIGMASGNWGALASFGARGNTPTKKLYGTYGNSFVAVVEFGAKVLTRSRPIFSTRPNAMPMQILKKWPSTAKTWRDGPARYIIPEQNLNFYRHEKAHMLIRMLYPLCSCLCTTGIALLANQRGAPPNGAVRS
jgi:hypothetical protein